MGASVIVAAVVVIVVTCGRRWWRGSRGRSRGGAGAGAGTTGAGAGAGSSLGAGGASCTVTGSEGICGDGGICASTTLPTAKATGIAISAPVARRRRGVVMSPMMPVDDDAQMSRG
ncbi:hypothetical protein JM654_22165 [Microbacterium oxydans]|nr:hypothetical protein [Microbacterium oxydans]